MVCKIHGLVWYDTLVSRFLNSKKKEMPEKFPWFKCFTLNNDGTILDPSSGVSSWQHIKQKQLQFEVFQLMLPIVM